MDTIYEGKEVTVGYAPQTAFGTPIAASANFTGINVDDFDIDRDVKVFEIAGSHGDKNVANDNIILNAQGSMSQFPINGPVSVYEIDELMYAFFHDVIHDPDTPYTKDFTPFATHPDFPSPGNEGHFLTFIKKFPGTSLSWLMSDCICKRFKILGEKNGMINFESDWVGRGTPTTSNDASGTWTYNTNEDAYYGYKFFNDITDAHVIMSDVGAGTTESAVTLQSFEMELNFEIEGVGQDGSGSFNSYGIHSRSGSFSMDILKDATAELLLTNQVSNAAVEASVRWGATGAPATTNLELIAKGKLAGDVSVKQDGLLGLSFGATMSVDTGEEMLEVLVANAIEKPTWPSS